MVPAGPRRTPSDARCAADSSRCGTSCSQKPAAAARAASLEGFPFAQSDLARRPRRHQRVGIIDFQDAVLGRPLTTWSRCCRMRGSIPRDAGGSRCFPLHQGAARVRPVRSRRVRGELRHHSGAAQHAAARHLRAAQRRAASRNICAISPASGPISPARSRIRSWRRCGPGTRRMCRRRAHDPEKCAAVFRRSCASNRA